MISLSDKKVWEKAVAKAREVKPLVKAVDFGQIAVAGANAVYIVRFEKSADGELTASCECKAHTAGQLARPCYHIAAAYSLYISQVNQQQSVASLMARHEEAIAAEMAAEVVVPPAEITMPHPVYLGQKTVTGLDEVVCSHCGRWLTADVWFRHLYADLCPGVAAYQAATRPAPAPARTNHWLADQPATYTATAKTKTQNRKKVA